MATLTKPIDLEPMECNIDLGELLIPNYIREHITFLTNADPSTMFYTIEASFQLSPIEPRIKTTGMVSMLDPDTDAKRVCDYKEKQIDALIDKVRTYYEVRDIKEDNNMPVQFCCERMSDYALKNLGIFKNSTAAMPQTKPQWINGLPAVKKVEIYNNRVVKMTFIDGTCTKSVCSENDIFDLDVGITICAMKRLLGTNSDDATKQYNKFIKHTHKVMEENALKEVAEKARKASDKAKMRKMELRKAAKKLKAREEQIDIQKQAYTRAMMEMTEDDLK